jgi:hypothetical protein
LDVFGYHEECNKVTIEIFHGKKRIGHTSFGMMAAIELTAKDDNAPKPTSVFMFGDPLNRFFIPSSISLLPGPTNVNIDRDK